MNVVRTGLPPVVALSLLAILAGGCADSEPPAEAPTISGPPAQVARVVERLERATRARDFATICDGLLTPAARARAGGEQCAASLSESVGRLRRPRIRVRSITISGPRATVVVRTTARREAAVEETLELERLDGRYRIAALAG